MRAKLDELGLKAAATHIGSGNLRGDALQKAIDFGWAAVAGQDGPDLVKRHAGRTRVVHLKPTVVNKEAGKKAVFGSDSVNWGANHRRLPGVWRHRMVHPRTGGLPRW